MDCLQARATLSEALERGVANTPGATHAREHCRTCEECRTFAEGLLALARAPKPKAPDAVIDAILERVAAMVEFEAEERAEMALLETADTSQAALAPEASSAEEGTEPEALLVPLPGSTGEEPAADDPRPAPRPVTPTAWPRERIIGVVAAAAAVFVALGITFRGYTVMSSRNATTAGSSDAALIRAPQAESGPAAGARGEYSPNYNTVPPGAPPATADKSMSTVGYVAFNGDAYVSLGSRAPDAASLTAAGSIFTALGTPDAPLPRTALRSGADAAILFIETSPGQYDGFRRVTRSRSGRSFALAPGGTLDRFGVWPTLPASFAAPTAPDGSPTFVAAGTDDGGQPIFAPPGASPDQGFAVGPGTSAADPAAGNPNWTWWQPRP